MSILDNIMLKWIRNKFMKNSKQKNNNNSNINIMAKLKIPRKFEIAVEEMDEHEDGTIFWKPVANNSGRPIIVTVSSPAEMDELVNTYKSIGQRFKILREVDPPTESDIKKFAIEQGLITENNSVNENSDVSENINIQANNQISNNITNNTEIQKQNINSYQNKNNIQNIQTKKEFSKPRIVTIGDIQIKYENDKVYQRQWVKLSSIEANQFRIINSATNKIVPMNGKHIEAKRWVLIEDENISSDDNTIDID